MAKIFLLAVVFCSSWFATAQTDSLVVPESQTLDLELLVAEATMNNPEIRASVSEMDAMDARIPQEKGLPDPQFKFMQENMPDFKFNEAMFSRFELMQEIPFPSKLGTRSDLSRIRAEHSHHDHLEKANEVIARLKMAYFELWLVQQNLILDRENARLMAQFLKIAMSKYGLGSVPQQDVLKAQVELSMIHNDLLSLRQRELSAKAMMMSILNRAPSDTLGFAVIPEQVEFVANLDSLLDLALHNRPMIVHDSLGIVEGETMLSLANEEYLPDLKIGVERITSPSGAQEGWSLIAGISIPFAPWSLGKSGARVDEANATISKATALYRNSQLMVTANVKDLFYKVQAAKEQLGTYRTAILPQAQQSLTASSTAYKTGQTDFLMVIDAYRTNVRLMKEYFMLRMSFDQSVAELEREVGARYIASGIYERNSQ
jgi:outer membrane protein TolC